MKVHLFPGKPEPKEVELPRLYNDIIMFITPSGKIADIGHSNTKMEYIKKKLGIEVIQINAYDFNNCRLKGEYDTIFCFETIEHLQNPLHFVGELKKILSDNGTLYISTPGRIKLLWGKDHFHEIPPSRLVKWIFEPLGLKVIRKRQLVYPFKWLFYLTGFRPLLRLFFYCRWIYEIRKNYET